MAFKIKMLNYRNYFSIFAKNLIHVEPKVRSGIMTIIVILTSLALWDCAHQGSLSGGPKDVVPPIPVEADPPDRSTHFNFSRITVTFSEFIQLKDPAKEIFISPPMQLKPEYKVHGKKLIVEFREPLKENSTYTINFGNAITDYTEGNPFTNFEYVFSTGQNIDSLWIAGRVLDAFTLAPVSDIIAMVYIDDNDTLPLDSLPARVPPRSAAKTDKDGKFSINNLSPGQYKLFALEDLNNNFYFDLPNERIGFLDSLVLLTPPPLDDTAEINLTDTVALLKPLTRFGDESVYQLYFFEEKDSTQKLLSKKLFGTNRLQYIFRMPVDSIEISLLETVPAPGNWFIPEFGQNRDTIDLWLQPGLPDTIKIRVSDSKNISDTSRFYLTQNLRAARQRKPEAEVLSFNVNTRAGALELNRDLILTFPGPLSGFDTTKMFLKSEFDSIPPVLTFTDTIHRKVKVSHIWEPGTAYRIMLDDSAFTDREGHVNDSTVITFKVRIPEDYGILLLTVRFKEDPGQYIVQLLDTKEKLIKEQIVVEPGTLRFGHLLPGKYKIKAIQDMNRDGRWNPGKYKWNLLPERVFYYPKEIEIRSNWDLQEEWTVVAE